MRKIRELLRLKYELGRSYREIATSLGIANSTVSDYVRRASAAGFSWPLPDGLDDAALEAALFPAPPPSRVPRPEPDWEQVHRELQRHKGVTLQLLWLEYRAVHPLSANGHHTRRQKMIRVEKGESERYGCHQERERRVAGRPRCRKVAGWCRSGRTRR